MNDLQVFANQDFGEIRVVDRDGEPWFVAKDIADILGYSETRNMVKMLDEDEKQSFSLKDISSNLDDNLTGRGTRTYTIINESGLYHAILSSKKPEAKKFRKWVTSEVLPAIRKTGSYSVAKSDDPRITQKKIAMEALEIELRVAQLLEVPKHLGMIEAVKEVEKQIGVDYSRLLNQSAALIGIKKDEVYLEPTELGEQLAKSLGCSKISGRQMNKILENLGLQVKVGNMWVPTKEGEEISKRHSWKSEHSTKSGYNYKWCFERVKDLVLSRDVFVSLVIFSTLSVLYMIAVGFFI